MELLPNDYILAYWFASDGQDNCWYLLAVKRDNTWVMQQTFRYDSGEEDSNPFDGKDQKNVTTFTLKGDVPEKEVLQKIDIIFGAVKWQYPTFHDWFLVQGDFKKFREIGMTKHYLHWKVEKAE